MNVYCSKPYSADIILAKLRLLLKQRLPPSRQRSVKNTTLKCLFSENLLVVLHRERWQEHSLKCLSKSGAWALSYKLTKFTMAHPFLKKLSARLKCVTTYAVGQLCITTMHFSINDSTAYIISSIYSIRILPYFVTLNCVKNSIQLHVEWRASHLNNYLLNSDETTNDR